MMAGSELAKKERAKWKGDKSEVSNFSDLCEEIQNDIAEIEYIGQLKSAVAGEKGKSISWSFVDSEFILASDITVEDEVVIYRKAGQVYWQEKKSFIEEFNDLVLEELKKILEK
jgi:hypothetical protein